MSFQRIQRRPTLAEEVSGQIKESILGGEYPAGKSLPTEPELAEQFGVSRAVVRDAVRMLSAQGLVDVQHGRGMFVTASLTDWFAESLYTTLRREGASVWDVEQFEELLYPHIFSLAARNITSELAKELHEATETYLKEMHDFNLRFSDRKEIPPEGAEMEKELFATNRRVFEIVFRAAGNRLLYILGLSTLAMRNFRYVPGPQESDEQLLEIEKQYMRSLSQAIGAGNAKEAADLARRVYHHSQEMIDQLSKVPIGEKPTLSSSMIMDALREADSQA